MPTDIRRRPITSPQSLQPVSLIDLFQHGNHLSMATPLTGSSPHHISPCTGHLSCRRYSSKQEVIPSLLLFFLVSFGLRRVVLVRGQID